jgi:nitrogen-specific signal transduction histidine kinase
VLFEAQPIIDEGMLQQMQAQMAQQAYAQIPDVVKRVRAAAFIKANQKKVLTESYDSSLCNSTGRSWRTT